MDVKDNFIKFLGTAGARFVMIRQLRASGGLWVSANNKNILIDPGPGSIVQGQIGVRLKYSSIEIKLGNAVVSYCLPAVGRQSLLVLKLIAL